MQNRLRCENKALSVQTSKDFGSQQHREVEKEGSFMVWNLKNNNSQVDNYGMSSQIK